MKNICFATLIFITFFSCTQPQQKTEMQKDDFVPHKKTRATVLLNDRMGSEIVQACKDELARNWLVLEGFATDDATIDLDSKENVFVQSLHAGDLYKAETIKNFIVPDFSVRVVQYPKDFTRGKITRVADIQKTLNDSLSDSMILLDPPIRTDAYLAKIKEEKPDVHFFTLMPTESILAMEAWSDLVLSFSLPSQQGTEESLETEEVSIDARKLSQALKLLCLIAKEKTTSVDMTKKTQRIELSVIASKISQLSETSSWTCGWYIDSDSGLRSRNHIVITTSSSNTQDNQNSMQNAH